MSTKRKTYSADFKAKLVLEVLEGEKIIPYIHAGSKLGVLVALKNTADTDVAGAGRDVAMQIAAMNPVAIDKENVSQEVIDKEMEIGRDQAKQEGKPENILDKIAEGKLNKFFKENCLLNQPYVRQPDLTVADVLNELIAKIGENITIRRFVRFQAGEASE